MPIIKSAIKKLRQDKKRRMKNLKIINSYKTAVKIARSKPTAKSVSAAISALDKAAKKSVIHKNKAARLKSSLTRKKS